MRQTRLDVDVRVKGRMVKIGDAAAQLGVSERALRYYEEQGLVRPARTGSGQRLYSDGDLRAVQRVRAMLAAGLGTAIIAEVLPCMRDDGSVVAPACAELVDALASERDRMTGSIRDLQEARAALDAIIAAAPHP
jgi:DNA-binding transcriptional MerR regulator